MKKFDININPKSLMYIVCCFVIIFIFVLFGVALNHYNSIIIDENNKLKSQIKDQQELKPEYEKLLKILSEKDVLALPNPEKKAIARGEAGKFQDDFRMIAGKAGLMMVSNTPDLNTLAGSSSSLLHNVVLKGEFANFRKMLIGLGAVAYLDRIEEINIQQNPDSMEFKMKIWIALK
jgi:hypothetical protein